MGWSLPCSILPDLLGMDNILGCPGLYPQARSQASPKQQSWVCRADIVVNSDPSCGQIRVTGTAVLLQEPSLGSLLLIS